MPSTSDLDTLQPSSQLHDSLAFNEQLKADSLNTLKQEEAVLGQLQFTSDSKLLLKYDLQGQKGEAYVDGKTYELTKMQFAENSYILSGPELTVRGENGSFNEMTSDCLYGMLQSVNFTIGDTKKQIEKVGVQHCPVY